MKFFAYAALVAAVSTKGPEPDVKKEFMMDMKYIATELKEINGDLQKLDKIEWEASKEHHHRHHHDGGDDDHHRHHRPHHNGGGDDHHRRPHHDKHHNKHHGEKKVEDKLQLDIIQIEQIVQGVLKGAVDTEGFTDIAKCLADVEHVLGDAQSAVIDFKKGGASNVIAGLKEIGDLLQTVKTGMADCSSTTADWERLEALAKTISSPKSFAYHVGKDLLINGKDIFGDISEAITDYDNQKWEAFGEEVGKAAAKTILGETNDVDCRGTYSNQSACDADDACSWCSSAAVRSSCNTVADAKSLPAAVFKCDKLSA